MKILPEEGLIESSKGESLTIKCMFQSILELFPFNQRSQIIEYVIALTVSNMIFEYGVCELNQQKKSERNILMN